MNSSSLPACPGLSCLRWLYARRGISFVALAGLAALIVGWRGPVLAQTTLTHATSQQSSQSDAEKKKQEEERKKREEAAKKKQQPPPPVKLRIPAQTTQPAATGQLPPATNAQPPRQSSTGTTAPQQPPTNQQPQRPGRLPVQQPQTPIYIPQPQQTQAPPVFNIPPKQYVGGRCGTTQQGRMAGFLIALSTWDEKKSKADSKCAFTAVNGSGSNFSFEKLTTSFVVSFSKLKFEPDGQVTEGKIDVSDFNPSAAAGESHAYTLALHGFQFEVHSLHIEPRMATGDLDLVITEAMDLRLAATTPTSSEGRAIEGALKCTVRGLLGDGMLQASCPLTAAWQVGTAPVFLGDPGGTAAPELRRGPTVRTVGKTASAFDIEWSAAASMATAAPATPAAAAASIPAVPMAQTQVQSQSVKINRPPSATLSPTATQALSGLSAQALATYQGPLYLKSPFIDKLDAKFPASGFSLSLAPDGIRGNISYANASFAPLFPDGFKLSECSGQYTVSASAIVNGTMSGKIALPDNYWDDNHHTVNATFSGTLDATGTLSAPIKLVELSKGTDPSIVWDAFGNLPEPPAIRIFLPKAIPAASLITIPKVQAGWAGRSQVIQEVQAGQPAQTIAGAAPRPADVVAMTQQAAAIPILTSSQYAAKSAQPEVRNFSPALARLEASSVARYSGKAAIVQPAALGNIAQILNQPVLWSLLMGKGTLNVWGKGHELVNEPVPSYGLKIDYGWVTTPWLGPQDETDPTKTTASPSFFFNTASKSDPGFMLTAAGVYGAMHYEVDHSVEFPAIAYSQYEGFRIQFEDFDLKFGRGRLADSRIHATLQIPFGDLNLELVNLEVDPTNDVNFVGGELISPEKWELGKGSPISIVPSVVILKEHKIVFDGLFYIDLLRNYKGEVQAFTAHEGKILVFRNENGHACAKLADMNISSDEKQSIGGLAATLHGINFDTFVACADEVGEGWPFALVDTDLVVPGFGKQSVQFQVFDGSYSGSTCGPPPDNLHADVHTYQTCIAYGLDHSGEYKDSFNLARQMPAGNNVEMVVGISLKLMPPDYEIWRGVSYMDVPQLGLVTGPWSADAVEGKTWQVVPSFPPDDSLGFTLPQHEGGSVLEGAHLQYTCKVNYDQNECSSNPGVQLDPQNPPDPANWIQFDDDTGISKFGIHGPTTMGQADKDGNSTGDVQVPSSDTAINLDKDTTTFSVAGTVPGGSDLTPGNASAKKGSSGQLDGKKLTLVNDGGFKLYFDTSDNRLTGSFDSFQPGSGGNNMPSGTPEVSVRFNFWVDGGYFDIGTGIKDIPVIASLKADGALGLFYTKKTEGAFLLGDVTFDWTGAGTGIKGEGHIYVDAFAKVSGEEVKQLLSDLIRKEIVKKFDAYHLWPPDTENYFAAGLGVHVEVDVLSWDLADLDADFTYEYASHLGPPAYPDGWGCDNCSGFRGYLGAKLNDIVHWRGRMVILNGDRDISTTCCDATVFWSDSCENPGDTGCHGLCDLF